VRAASPSPFVNRKQRQTTERGFVKQFDEAQIRRAVETIQAATWGDIDGNLSGIHDGFTRLREVTRADLQVWEDYLDGRLPDEFSISRQKIEELSEEWRNAYVARLVESLYILWCGYSEADEHVSTPGQLVHALNDILWLPLVGKRGRPKSSP
jgi:hypothetical protein